MITTITTVDQIRRVASPVFVRWSNSIEQDIERGYSLRYGTQPEMGLSSNDLDKSWPDWRILRAIREYQFTRAENCWLITGRVVGRGGDNEPLLADVEVIGRVDESLLAVNWKRMKMEEDLARNMKALENITDPFAREITIKAINKIKAELEEE